MIISMTKSKFLKLNRFNFLYIAVKLFIIDKADYYSFRQLPEYRII